MNAYARRYKYFSAVTFNTTKPICGPPCIKQAFVCIAFLFNHRVCNLLGTSSSTNQICNLLIHYFAIKVDLYIRVIASDQST